MDADNLSERRRGADRRVRDIGPPSGVTERRMRPERRCPDVEFVEFDEFIELTNGNGISAGLNHAPHR